MDDSPHAAYSMVQRRELPKSGEMLLTENVGLPVAVAAVTSGETLKTESAEIAILPRKQGEARRIASTAYRYRCCVVCGLQISTCLTVAHLDHNPGNNSPENLAFLCQTHHWMFDSGLYPIEAIKLLREHWQMTEGKPSHKARMKDAGQKAALARKRSRSARKAWSSRRANIGERRE